MDGAVGGGEDERAAVTGPRRALVPRCQWGTYRERGWSGRLRFTAVTGLGIVTALIGCVRGLRAAADGKCEGKGEDEGEDNAVVLHRKRPSPARGFRRPTLAVA